jgi:hypothetical protein
MITVKVLTARFKILLQVIRPNIKIINKNTITGEEIPQILLKSGEPGVLIPAVLPSGVSVRYLCQTGKIRIKKSLL